MKNSFTIINRTILMAIYLRRRFPNSMDPVYARQMARGMVYEYDDSPFWQGKALLIRNLSYVSCYFYQTSPNNRKSTLPERKYAGRTSMAGHIRDTEDYR